MHRGSTGLPALAAALALTTAGAAGADLQYPDWHGQWDTVQPRFGGQSVKYDPSKPFGRAQEAPLTPEYRKIHEESIADQAQGGQGNFLDHAKCIPGGMPSMMSVPTMEFVVTPRTTYISAGSDLRRIFTDGRPWPANPAPTYQGYSIGRWIDPDASGRYRVLEAETRYFKGPRAVDPAGLPLAFDNQSIFLERFHLDGADPNILHDEMTIIDHAFTRPWTVDKRYVRRAQPHPDWVEAYCTEGTALVFVGKDEYYVSGDGKLMPTKPGQAPPDLTYFRQKK